MELPTTVMKEDLYNVLRFGYDWCKKNIAPKNIRVGYGVTVPMPEPEEHEDDEECAYWVLRCVTEDMFPGYFEPGLKTLRSDLEELDYRFSRVSEEAHDKLQSMGLAVKFFTARWLMCGLVGCAAAPIVLRARFAHASAPVFSDSSRNECKSMREYRHGYA